MADIREPFHQQRWVSCRNVGSDIILPHQPVEHTGLTVTADGATVILVRTITADGTGATCMNGYQQLLPGVGYGLCTFDEPFVARFFGVVNPHGSTYGPAAGSTGLASGITENAFAFYGAIGGAVGGGARLGLFRRANTLRPKISVNLSASGVTAATNLSWTGQFAEDQAADYFQTHPNGIRVIRTGTYLIAQTTAFLPSSVQEDDGTVRASVLTLNGANGLIGGGDGHVHVDGLSNAFGHTVHEFGARRIIAGGNTGRDVVTVQASAGIACDVESTLTIWT